MSHYIPSASSWVRPVIVSSYPPRKCGIATFTKDLRAALAEVAPTPAKIIALQGADPITDYGEEVLTTINKHELASYSRAARVINNSSTNVVSLQHEYGLFGGDTGYYALHFLEQVNRPIITTFHTILDRPSPLQRAILHRIADRSERVITMVEEGRRRLIHRFGVDPRKITVIPHGTTPHSRSTGESKAHYGWQDMRVLLMSGLLGPGKGAEHVVEALPEIVREYPNTLFVLAGQTHPEIVKQHGETYRRNLLRRAATLGVARNIQMVNRYLPLDELLSLYDAADIYLTPHLEEQQIASGTLAYAIGMGKACVSTPYVYARETLSQGRGLLVNFADSASISDAVLAIFREPALQHQLEERAYQLGQTMFWPEVAKQYIETFQAAYFLPVMERYATPQLATSRSTDR